MIPVLDKLIEIVMGKLVDAGIKKIASILGVNSEMEALQRNLKNISLVLVDAESKKIEDKAVALWLAELREVLYDAEDLLDDFPDAKRGKSKSVKDILRSILGYSKIEEALAKTKISITIGNINSNLTRITSQTSILQLLASLPNSDKKVSRYNSSRITGTCSFQLDSEIVGIDDDAKQLANRITGDSNCAHSLFAITGMGGLGKTTLARKVFNHYLIRNHFHNTVWVCVSRNCSGEYLLKEIVRSIDKNYSESRVSLNELSSKVIEVVKEKMVFIVLDDIWDSHVWEKFLRVPLFKGENYSRILVTTRNEKVAKEMKVGHTHRMTKMNLSDGWSMLCKIVFEEKDNGDMNELEKVGKEIVDRCDGLPLAINVVGGVLRTIDRTIAAWARVLSSTTWSMPDLPEDVLPSLLLSYEDLPLHLKRCFAYCSLFPEDYQISRFNLEHLWIAEGFIKKEEGKDVEYSAREYHNELKMRNLFQASDYQKYYPTYCIKDDLTYCNMHDLLRSLAIFVSQNQYIYLQSNNSGLTRRHYLSFIGNDTKVVSEEIKKEDRVRTLLLSRNPRITMVSSELLSSLRRLRVLDLQRTGIETLPDSLGALIHLRFFDVSNTPLNELPDSLGVLIHLRFLNISYTELTKLPYSIKNLKNLETLEATGSSSLRSLPTGISELFNLRCLRLDRLYYMPVGLDNLKNLRILESFVVNDCTTTNMKELKDLSQLTDLSIFNLERVASKEEAEEAAIEKKTNLECLELHCEPPPLISDEDIKKIEEVFAGIKLPENLTDLHTHGFFGKQLPDHMTSDRLRQLTSLELVSCQSLTRLPSLGDMPKLQRLLIRDAESIVEFGAEFLGSLKFPKLEELILCGMKNLERMFDVERGAFPCLVKLFITFCRKLNSLGKGLNHATCLKTLKVSFLDNLKSIENLSSISELELECNKTLSSVKNLPSLKIMKIDRSPLKDVKNVGELDFLQIEADDGMKTLPRWLKSITPPKLLSVQGGEELVLRTQQSVEDQNIMKKCLYAEVRSSNGPKYSVGFNHAFFLPVTLK